jgi:DNA (cytosine-5)-methyltransferase 1
VWSLSENQRGELLCAPVAASLAVGGGKPGQGYPAVVIAPQTAATQPAASAASASGGEAMRPPSTTSHGDGVDAVTVSGTLTARVGKGPSSTADDGALVLQPPANATPTPPSGAAAVPASPPGSAGLRKRPPPGQSETARRAAVTVRRLTPTECERLQGFPDGWTAIDADRRSLSDTARYRFMGNAATVPVVAWIAARLRAAHHTSGALPLVPPLPPRPPNPSQEDSRD